MEQLYILYSHGDNETQGVYTTLEQAVENLDPDCGLDRCQCIHAVIPNRNYDFLQDNKYIVKDDYKKLRQKLYRKRKVLETMPFFSEKNGIMADAKILCSSSVLNREIIEKFYNTHLENFITLMGVPVISGRNLDDKPIFMRKYSFDEKCFIIQAAIDRLSANTDSKVITLKMDRVIDL